MLKATDQRLGDYLLEAGILTLEQLDRVLREQKATGEDLGAAVVRLGYATKEQVLQALAEALEIPYLNLTEYSIDPKAIEVLSKEVAYKCRVVPVFKIGNVVTVAMVDPRDVTVMDQIRRETGLEVEPAVSSESDILQALEQYYGPSTVLDHSIDEVIQVLQEQKPDSVEEQKKAEELQAIAEEAPVIKLVNLILSQAIRDRASDIHIEPESDSLRVRYRIDGVLHEAFSPPKSQQAAIISRIKILSEMDIAESRMPQDGRFQASVDGQEVDIRVSTLPTVYGENVVMRILDKSSLHINLEDLGFSEDALARFKSILSSSYGIILVTGPTGSGKTTTLYSALHSVNSLEKNIITIEDPVEYRLKLVRQSQVNPKAGLTFASGLRAILRQDPDIIMVGEIRDSETAKIAVQAALTGHLVLSTLHTNDAPGALTRLIEMGVEPFLIASATVGVVAQRLVRKICSRCRVEYTPSESLLRELRIARNGNRPLSFHRGEGCTHCKKTGYKGRIGIYEIMTLTEEIRELALRQASTDQIKQAALKSGMRTLRHDGLVKALRGITTIEEVLRVTNLD